MGSTNSNNTAAAAVAAAMDQQHDQTIANVLQSLDKSNQARIALMHEDTAPCRECALLSVFQEYQGGQLKAAKSELQALENAGYKSDDSDVINARRELVLCKRKRDETFSLLSNSDLSK